MSNDELQRAIDDITMGDAGMSAPVTPAMENSDNNKLADEIANALAESDFEDVAPNAIVSSAAMPEVMEELEDVPQMPKVAPSDAFAAEMEKMTKEAEAEPEDEPVMESAVEPEMPKVEPEMPKEEPVMEEKVEEVKIETAPAGDLEEVKRNALKELYPLLKNMNINPEQTYEICKEVAEMGEKAALNEAFEAAKKIQDVNKRANALFDIVKMIEK